MTEQAGVTTPVTDRPLTAGDVFHFHKSRQEAGYAPVTAVFVDDIGVLLERCDGVRRWVDHSPDHSITFVSRPPSVSADPVGGVTSGAGEVETQTCVDWDEYADDIADAISDSMDMDWTSSDGARAVVRWLTENAPYSPALTPSPPVQLSERERALEGALATYDAAVAPCPINGPEKQWDRSADCKRCGARQDQNCGLEASASYTLIKSVRAALTRTTGEG